MLILCYVRLSKGLKVGILGLKKMQLFCGARWDNGFWPNAMVIKVELLKIVLTADMEYV